MTENEEMLQEEIMIRDLLRARRAAMPELTNQDIANMAGLSVNTVNHCLSERLQLDGCAKRFMHPLIRLLALFRTITKKIKFFCRNRLKSLRKNAADRKENCSTRKNWKSEAVKS